MDAAPFAALRYDPAIAGDAASTSAPAYDDLERFTYARHRTASPYTVLELLTGDDGGTADAFRAAGATFQRWRRTGVLVEEVAPAYYLYEIHELRSGVPAVLRGVLAAVGVVGQTLLPHEAVDPARLTSRIRRLDVVPADLAPVFAVHSAGPATLREVLDAAPTTRPVLACTDEAGTDHRVWRLDDAVVPAVREGLSAVTAVIADGHHRFAAAAARAAQRGMPARTLTYLVDGSAYGPELRAVHRLVELPAPQVLALLGPDFDVRHVPLDELAGALADFPGVAFGVIGGSLSTVVAARDAAAVRARLPGGHSQAWMSLDASAWEFALRPRFGDARVSYRSDARATAAEVLAGADATLFVLRPPSLDDVFACALAKETMPAKSTWFRPKPRAGLVMRSLD